MARPNPPVPVSTGERHANVWPLTPQRTPTHAIRRKTHSAQGGVQQVKPGHAERALRPGSGSATGNDGGGLVQGTDRPGLRSAAQSDRPVPDTLLPGAGWRNSERRIWGWRRAQSAQGETCLVTVVRGKERGSQWDQRPRRQPARRWKLRRNRERPVRCSQTTGACEICGLVNAVQQPCRIGNGRVSSW